MIVTAWNHGSHSKTGAGYGFKLAAKDRDAFFSRGWTEVEVLLPDGTVVHANVSKPSFWNDTCRELIHQEFGKWLIANGFAPWKKGRPPKFELKHEGGKRFTLNPRTPPEPEQRGAMSDQKKRRAKSQTGGQAEVARPTSATTRFSQVVYKTYHRQGFFNVKVAHEHAFGKDGEPIDVFCGESDRPITGEINRRCNTNNTPRIMGGTGLRDWFHDNVEAKDEVEILVYSPNAIRIQGSIV